MTDSISIHDVVTVALDRFILDGRIQPTSPLDARLLAGAVAHTIQKCLLERGYEIRRKEAVLGGNARQSLEHAKPETASNDERKV